MNLIEYNPMSGDIIRNIALLNIGEAGIQSPSIIGGILAVVENSGINSRSHWVDNHQITAYTPEQVIARSNIPTYPAFWNNQTMSWQSLLDLSSSKLSKRNLINKWRLQANYSGFMHGGKLIASDQLSMLDITNTANEINQNNSLPANWPGAWKAVDNSYIPITSIQDWRAFFSSMYQQGLNNFSISQQLKTLVDSATTVAEVEAIIWPT